MLVNTYIQGTCRVVLLLEYYILGGRTAKCCLGAWLAPIEGLFHSGLETMHARPLPYHKSEQGMR